MKLSFEAYIDCAFKRNLLYSKILKMIKHKVGKQFNKISN